MAKFESALGGKTFTSQQMREFDIPDESESEQMPNRRQQDFRSQMDQEYQHYESNQEKSQEFNDLERQVKEAREVRRSGKERLNDGAKRRIEILIGMTRTTREFTILENTFVLQTLRSKEMRDAIMIASEYDGTVQSPFEVRRQLLARSLVQVAGVDVAQFVGSDKLEDRLTLIDNLDESLLNRLFDEYDKMVTESKNKFSFKNDLDAKEVVEDLKK